MKGDFYIVTCEHGGNRVPSRYRQLFDGNESLLASHRGYDAGALRLARDTAALLDAALFVSTTSRLLIDLNRSPLHPRLYSEITRGAAKPVQKEIRQRYYQPYRTKVENRIAAAIADGYRVVHLSCHSFTPELDGRVRDADFGLLYATERAEEAAFCRRWRGALREHAPTLRLRLNYPYAGDDDGFTRALRGKFAENRYLGIEVEVNQRHVLGDARHWNGIRAALLRALAEVTRPQARPRPHVAPETRPAPDRAPP